MPGHLRSDRIWSHRYVHMHASRGRTTGVRYMYACLHGGCASLQYRVVGCNLFLRKRESCDVNDRTRSSDADRERCQVTGRVSDSHVTLETSEPDAETRPPPADTHHTTEPRESNERCKMWDLSDAWRHLLRAVLGAVVAFVSCRVVVTKELALLQTDANMKISTDSPPGGAARISVKWGEGYEWPTDKWGMGVCSGRRPSGRRWGMGVCRPGNTPARGGYGRYEAIQPDFAPETGARRRNFRPQCITSDDFPRLDPPPLSRLRPGPPPLSALSVRRRDHPPWSRYLESIFTIWENGTTRRCASK